jgi:hypothetical protein
MNPWRPVTYCRNLSCVTSILPRTVSPSVSCILTTCHVFHQHVVFPQRSVMCSQQPVMYSQRPILLPCIPSTCHVSPAYHHSVACILSNLSCIPLICHVSPSTWHESPVTSHVRYSLNLSCIPSILPPIVSLTTCHVSPHLSCFLNKLFCRCPQ